MTAGRVAGCRLRRCLRSAGCRTGRVVGTLVVVGDHRDAGTSPGLVDAQRHPRIGVVVAGTRRHRLEADRGARVQRTAAGEHRRRRQVGERLQTTLVGTDVQGDAVAQLPGIGDLVGAVGAGVALVLRLVQRAHAGVAEAAFVVGERHRPAEGEAAPLDEGTGDVGRFNTVLVLHVVGLERPQGAVGSLRARVDREAATMAGRVVVDRTVPRTGRTRVLRGTGAGDAIAVVGPDIAREPDTGVGTGDVVEPVSIERADLHVLDRLGLDGKIGGLRPGNSDHTGRRTEEKTFHHLHFEPSKLRYWRVVSVWCFRTVESPLSPHAGDCRRAMPLRTATVPSKQTAAMLNLYGSYGLFISVAQRQHS